jgi:hypothetical protein
MIFEQNHSLLRRNSQGTQHRRSTPHLLELRPMIRKLALGLLATATVAAAALAPSAASAFTVKVGPGYHPHWHHHHHRVYVAPPLFVGAPVMASSCMEKRLIQTRKGLRWRTVNVCAF